MNVKTLWKECEYTEKGNYNKYPVENTNLFSQSIVGKNPREKRNPSHFFTFSTAPTTITKNILFFFQKKKENSLLLEAA